MKKIGEHTSRGQIPHQITTRIPLFDGSFKTGYRVVEFLIAAQDIQSGRDAFGTLFTEASGTNNWNWDENIQIAWAATGGATDDARAPFTLVDPDNLVVDDIFVRGSENTGANLNYFIRFEKYEISDWRGALAMVRSRSQNV